MVFIVLIFLRMNFFFWSQVTPVNFPGFWDCSKGSNNNWCYRHLHVQQSFQLSDKIQVLVNLFVFFYFHSLVAGTVRCSKKKNRGIRLYFELWRRYFLVSNLIRPLFVKKGITVCNGKLVKTKSEEAKCQAKRVGHSKWKT